MKILCIADTQLDSGRTLTPKRLQDQEEMLAEIVDIADREAVGLVLHCGDVFETRHPSEEARLVFKRFANDITGPRRLIVMAGNHDLRNAELPSAVDLYDNVNFIRTPHTLHWDDVSVSFLPWTPPHQLRARLPGTPAAEINAQMGELLVRAAEDLHRQTNRRSSVLVLHWMISGFDMTERLATMTLAEPIIPLHELQMQGWDAIVAGHIHTPQKSIGDQLAFYCGSPWVCSWGETESEHGVWLLDVSGHVGSQATFVPVRDREFVNVQVDLEPEYGEMETLRDALWRHDLPPDSVVRLRYTATPEQARNVDAAYFRRFAAERGFSIRLQCDVVRPPRARVEGVERLPALEAVAMWVEHQRLGQPLGDRLGAWVASALGDIE